MRRGRLIDVRVDEDGGVWVVTAKVCSRDKEAAEAFAATLAQIEIEQRRREHQHHEHRERLDDESAERTWPSVRAALEYAVQHVGPERAVDWCLEHAEQVEGLKHVKPQRRRGRVERVAQMLAMEPVE